MGLAICEGLKRMITRKRWAFNVLFASRLLCAHRWANLLFIIESKDFMSALCLTWRKWFSERGRFDEPCYVQGNYDLYNCHVSMHNQKILIDVEFKDWSFLMFLFCWICSIAKPPSMNAFRPGYAMWLSHPSAPSSRGALLRSRHSVPTQRRAIRRIVAPLNLGTSFSQRKNIIMGTRFWPFVCVL